MATTTEQERGTLQALTEADVMSVYSGKAGRCCCGCAGKHQYSSAHRAAGSRYRGYAVLDDEVSDAQVRRVLRILQKNAEDAQFLGSCFTVEIGKRLYIVYLLKAARGNARPNVAQVM